MNVLTRANRLIASKVQLGQDLVGTTGVGCPLRNSNVPAQRVWHGAYVVQKGITQFTTDSISKLRATAITICFEAYYQLTERSTQFWKIHREDGIDRFSEPHAFPLS